MNIKIIENFLDKKDLNFLCSLNVKHVGSNEVKVYENRVFENHIFQNDCIDDKKLKALNHRYHNVALNILKELNPAKIKLYDYSEFYIIETGSNYKFPIHDDTPNRILSGVIYLKPEQNSGTIFYKNKKGADKKEIEWKINRAIFFSRLERETWHSYEGNGTYDRIALVYNLMTTQIKKVYEIEKKSYFIGNLRWKLNPYLYQYFKLYL